MWDEIEAFLELHKYMVVAGGLTKSQCLSASSNVANQQEYRNLKDSAMCWLNPRTTLPTFMLDNTLRVWLLFCICTTAPRQLLEVVADRGKWHQKSHGLGAAGAVHCPLSLEGRAEKKSHKLSHDKSLSHTLGQVKVVEGQLVHLNSALSYPHILLSKIPCTTKASQTKEETTQVLVKKNHRKMLIIFT